MEAQRLRNLTTRYLHTHISHVYEDIEAITGMPGVMTHMLPNAAKALEPYLREVVPDPKFWNDKYDPTHAGTVDVPVMDEARRAIFVSAYTSLPHPFADRDEA